MSTFYAVPDLEQLLRIYQTGNMDEGFLVYEDIHDAEDHAWDGETVIVAFELDDPDAFLGVDWDHVDSQAEQLAAESRPAVEGDPTTGLFDSFFGHEVTWDSPDALEAAMELRRLTEDETVTWRDSIADFRSAELLQPIPMAALTLMSPVDFTEIEDKVAYREAVDAMEPVALSSLGGSFWAWLLMFMAYFWGPQGETDEEVATRKGEERRRRKGGRKKKKRKARKRKVVTKKQAELGYAY